MGRSSLTVTPVIPTETDGGRGVGMTGGRTTRRPIGVRGQIRAAHRHTPGTRITTAVISARPA